MLTMGWCCGVFWLLRGLTQRLRIEARILLLFTSKANKLFIYKYLQK